MGAGTRQIFGPEAHPSAVHGETARGDTHRRPRPPHTLGWTELALIVVLFAAVETVLFGSRLINGGLYTDDWSLAAISHQYGVGTLIRDLLSILPGRPLGVFYIGLVEAVSGTNPHWEALWGLLTLPFATCAAYVLLRRLSMGRIPALAACALFMAFPWADSGWLWASASNSYLAVGLAFAGATFALVGLERDGTAARLYWLLAAVFYAASVLTYQTTTVLICCSILLYWGRATPRRAIKTWLADVVVVALCVAIPWLVGGSQGSEGTPVTPLPQWWAHARQMFGQGATLLTSVAMPFGGPHRDVVLPVLFIVVGAALLVAYRHRADRRIVGPLLLWLKVVGAGAVVVITGYLIFVPAPAWIYQPVSAGGNNRVNVTASLGYVLAVVGLAMLIGWLIAFALDAVRAALPGRRGRRPAITVDAGGGSGAEAAARWFGTSGQNTRSVAGLALVIGTILCTIWFVGYARMSRQDVANWNLAGRIQRREMATIKGLGRPAPNTTLYTFNGVGAVASQVFVFRVTWDLNGAYELMWNSANLHAYPIFSGTDMQCTATQVVPDGPANGDGAGQATAYPHAVFYDFRTGDQLRITDRAVCERAIATFTPGPLQP